MTAEVSIRSGTIDTLLEFGMAIEVLGRALLRQPELELRVRNGVISIWRSGERFSACGYAGVEPTASDWLDIAAGFVASKEQSPVIVPGDLPNHDMWRHEF